MLNSFLDDNKEFLLKVTKLINNLYKRNQFFPLDIIKNSFVKGNNSHNNTTTSAARRQLSLKNVVIQIIDDNKIERNKPSLAKIAFYLKQRGGFDMNLKENKERL